MYSKNLYDYDVSKLKKKNFSKDKIIVVVKCKKKKTLRFRIPLLTCGKSELQKAPSTTPQQVHCLEARAVHGSVLFSFSPRMGFRGEVLSQLSKRSCVWRIPKIPALRRLRQEYHKIDARLGYTASLRPVGAT